MTATTVVAVRMAHAHNRVQEVVMAHGSLERAQRLEDLGAEATPRLPVHLASYQGELMAALAEIVEEQNARIEALEKRVGASTGPKKAEAKK
jgi:hypothetical protein